MKKGKKRIFTFSKPKATNAVKETFVARYPNGKVETE